MLREILESLVVQEHDDHLQINQTVEDGITEISNSINTTSDNIFNAIKSADNTNHTDNQSIISELGGVIKSGDAVTVDGEITIEGVPPVEGAAEFFPAVISKL